MNTDRYTESGDSGAAQVRGYSAAEAARVFQQFLERELSTDGFWQWLHRYPYTPEERSDLPVENEINRATLAIRALQEGQRTWEDVRDELLDARSRLTGHARI